MLYRNASGENCLWKEEGAGKAVTDDTGPNPSSLLIEITCSKFGRVDG